LPRLPENAASLTVDLDGHRLPQSAIEDVTLWPTIIINLGKCARERASSTGAAASVRFSITTALPEASGELNHQPPGTGPHINTR
jgi:hypothetical protein